MSLFDKFSKLAQARALLDGAPIAPVATPMEQIHSASEGTIDGKRVILAGTNNYLGLTFDADALEAAKNAIATLGTGTTGSRMANGSYHEHLALEQEFAAAYNWPAAIVFSTGYQACLGTISALAGPDDYLLLDADSHASIMDGARLSQAQTILFRHNDPANLDRRLQRLGDDARRTLVVVEGLYSMLGDRPPLAEFVEVVKRHHAWLLLDEAHSFGVFGEHGLGLAEQEGLLDQADFIVGTFSKSLAGIGGFCVSPHAELDMLRYASRPYIFTASPSPAVIASTRETLKKVLDGGERRTQLWRNINRLYSELERMGFRLGSADPSPVAAVILPEREIALTCWQGLLDAGVYANLMLPPATPNGLNLLRVSLSAAHSDAQMDHIVNAFETLRKYI